MYAISLRAFDYEGNCCRSSPCVSGVQYLPVGPLPARKRIEGTQPVGRVRNYTLPVPRHRWQDPDPWQNPHGVFPDGLPKPGYPKMPTPWQCGQRPVPLQAGHDLCAIYAAPRSAGFPWACLSFLPMISRFMVSPRRLEYIAIS